MCVLFGNFFFFLLFSFCFYLFFFLSSFLAPLPAFFLLFCLLMGRKIGVGIIPLPAVSSLLPLFYGLVWPLCTNTDSRWCCPCRGVRRGGRNLMCDDNGIHGRLCLWRNKKKLKGYSKDKKEGWKYGDRNGTEIVSSLYMHALRNAV
ncbi:hypothetical protein P167DRAFT_226453 [Morchella conica CCBAS932]|uniref:Uncharacterized protein n=1 Tax=Morchella conica CCBAS932 TaxID=1392247 RepID=A0A3N4KP26_9PEZI|nr:hypothetical protein P167DRAFT_226453 [Morchella conica CCBAS932]